LIEESTWNCESAPEPVLRRRSILPPVQSATIALSLLNTRVEPGANSGDSIGDPSTRSCNSSAFKKC
jgi:hypothetical protein